MFIIFPDRSYRLRAICREKSASQCNFSVQETSFSKETLLTILKPQKYPTDPFAILIFHRSISFCLETNQKLQKRRSGLVDSRRYGDPTWCLACFQGNNITRQSLSQFSKFVINKLHVVQKRRYQDFKAPWLWKGQSGSPHLADAVAPLISPPSAAAACRWPSSQLPWSCRPRLSCHALCRAAWWSQKTSQQQQLLLWLMLLLWPF